jgi:hypothetical protein
LKEKYQKEREKITAEIESLDEENTDLKKKVIQLIKYLIVYRIHKRIELLLF